MKKFFATLITLLIMSAQVEAMDLQILPQMGFITLGSDFKSLHISGSSLPEGDYPRGNAQFGDLYFHFDMTLSERDFEEFEDLGARFGSNNFENAVPIYVMEGGTKIYPVFSDDGRKFFLLITETGGGGSSKLIGLHNGKWVKYFDTLEAKNSALIGWDFYLQDFYTCDDTIIFAYTQDSTNLRREIRYKWNEAAQWFGIDVK